MEQISNTAFFSLLPLLHLYTFNCSSEKRKSELKNKWENLQHKQVEMLRDKRRDKGTNRGGRGSHEPNCTLKWCQRWGKKGLQKVSSIWPSLECYRDIQHPKTRSQGHMEHITSVDSVFSCLIYPYQWWNGHFVFFRPTLQFENQLY